MRSQKIDFEAMIHRVITLYRNAYGGISTDIWLLAFVMLINRSGTMVIPFLSIYLTQALHFSLPDAGLMVGCGGIGGILGIYLGGKLTDKVGHYYVQIVSLIMAGCLFFVLMQMRSLPSLCITIFCLSLIGEAFRPANSTSIAYYSTPDNRTRSYSLNRLAINLGWAIGPALGGIFATIGYQYLFIADGLTNLLAAVFLLFFVKNKNKEEVEMADNQAEITNNDGITQPLTSPLKDAVFVRFLIFTTLFAIPFMAFFTVGPVFWKKELGISEFWIGMLMAGNGLLVALVEMILIYFIEHRQSKITFISWGVLFCAASYLLFNLFPRWAWIVPFSIVVATMSEMFTMPFMNSFTIERSVSQNRGQYAAYYSMCYSVAHIAAPVLGMQIAAKYGFHTLWWLFIGLCLVSFWGFRSILSK